ncbi:MAG: HIG1 domain-containing protein [Burkholderiales bacterium]|nr:HIG1 domain-containing protein [Burkholderiales bacterium]
MDPLFVLVLVGAALTIIAFVRGIASMTHGGVEDHQASHRLMFQRVGWQALTVLLIIVLGLLTQVR